jgi:hypothetical protein
MRKAKSFCRNFNENTQYSGSGISGGAADAGVVESSENPDRVTLLETPRRADLPETPLSL